MIAFKHFLFLQTLDELMGSATEQYRCFKLAWRQGRVNGDPPTAYMEHLMECTVSSNFAMQHVLQLEQQLALENPRLALCTGYLRPPFSQNL